MRYVDLRPFKPERDLPLEKQAGQFLMATTIWGEARGEGLDAMAGVANVIINRAVRPGKWWADQTYLFKHYTDPTEALCQQVKAVVLKPWQFSIFNKADPNREKLLEPWKHDRASIWNQCQVIAAASIDGLLEDNTEHSDHYHSFPLSLLAKWPKWAKVGPLPKPARVRVGPFRFYGLEI